MGGSALSDRLVFELHDAQLAICAGSVAVAMVGDYNVVPVAVANARSSLAIGTKQVQVDTVQGFSVGAEISIRNEYRFGRANYPVAHSATIVDVSDSTIVFAPPVPDNRFKDARGSFLRRHSPALRVTAWRLIDATHAAGDCGGVLVNLSLEGYSLKVGRLFKQAMTVGDETLALQLNGPLRAVHRKNRQVDREHFQSEYWLADQGLVFEVDTGGWMMAGAQQCDGLRLVWQGNFGLRPVSSFKSGHPIGNARDLDINRYAAALMVDGAASFEICFPTPRLVRGVHLVWYNRLLAPSV